MDALNIMNKWRHDWDLTHLTAEMQELTKYGKPRRGGHMTARRSATQDIQAQIREAKNMDERRQAQKLLSAKRKQIEKDRDNTQMLYVLKNLVGGGWGKKNMTRQLQGMAEYKDGLNGTLTSDTSRIAEEATKYYVPGALRARCGPGGRRTRREASLHA